MRAMVVLALIAGALAGCWPRSGNVVALSDAQVDSARTRWPDATRVQMERGRRLALAHCGDCHGVPIPAHLSAAEWPAMVHTMAGRAGLVEAADREAVARFYVAATY